VGLDLAAEECRSKAELNAEREHVTRRVRSEDNEVNHVHKVKW